MSIENRSRKFLILLFAKRFELHRGHFFLLISVHAFSLREKDLKPLEKL
jgi:hypothetical protein